MKIIKKLKIRKEIAFTLLVDLLFLIIFFTTVGFLTEKIYSQFPDAEEITQDTLIDYYEEGDTTALESTLNLIEEMKGKIIKYASIAATILLILLILSRLLIYKILSNKKFIKKFVLWFIIINLVSMVVYLLLIYLSYMFLNTTVFYLVLVVLTLLYLYKNIIISTLLSMDKKIRLTKKIMFKKELIKAYLVMILMLLITCFLFIFTASLPNILDFMLSGLVFLTFINWTRNYIFLTITHIKA